MKKSIKYLNFGVHIKCSDFFKSYNFYKTLGLIETFAYGPQEFIDKLEKKIPVAKEKYHGIVFKIGNSTLEIADGHLAVRPEIFKTRIESSKISTMIEINSIESLIALCNLHEIKISTGPTIYPWGTKEVVIKDPDGFVLVFIERL
jgi:hypothetical protein